MTDFSRNQISSIRLKSHTIDRWVIPNDRQLALRAKLGAGWSVRTNRSETYAYHDDHAHNDLTDEELQHIMRVVGRASMLEDTEKVRIGHLVNHYERLKDRCHGDGVANCLLCGTEFQKFRSQSFICSDCKNGVCSECSVDTINSAKEKQILCKICSEKRELWKRSGAWFFGDIPPHSNITASQMHMFRPDSRTTRPLTPELDGDCSVSLQSFPRHVGGSPVPQRFATPPVSVGDPDSISNVMEYKKVAYRPGRNSSSEDSDVDSFSDSSSELSFNKDRAKQYLKAAKEDDDVVSVRSVHLMNSPLLNRRKNSGTSEASSQHISDQISATESTQDLRLISLKPNIQETFSVMVRAQVEEDEMEKAAKTQKSSAAVSFDADVISMTSEGFAAPSIKGSNPNMARCISIPNAELDDEPYLEHEEEDRDSPYGSISFTVFYHEQTQQLDIELFSAKHLPIRDQPYNAYVMINLVPSLGNSRKQRTKTQYNTMDPKWKQKVTYCGISLDELLFKSLVFSVYDEFMISSDVLVGEFRLPLRQIRSYELIHYHVFLERKVALPSDEAMTGEERGKILLSVRYNTKASQLHVAVVRCAALHIPNTDAFADPYVKLYLQPDYSKNSKKKTQILKKTLNPEFHEEFIYQVSRKTLEKRSLEVTVWDNKVMRNVFLGGVSLSQSSSSSSEKAHWANVISQPDRRHDFWHPLRDILTK